MIEALEREYEINNQRITQLREHLKVAETQVNDSHFKTLSKTKEIETEKQLKSLVEREHNRLLSDAEKVQQEKDQLQERANHLQNEIFNIKGKIEDYKKKMDMDASQLEQWAIARKQKEEDNVALAKYAKQDEGKIRELSLQVEKLTKDLKSKQNRVEQEVMIIVVNNDCN